MRFEEEQLAGEIKDCRYCSACHYQNPVVGEGPKNAYIIIAGRSPGFVENKIGRPFVGPGGRLLDKHLAMMLIPRMAIGLINVLNCFKRDDAVPTVEEYEACRDLWIEKKVSFFNHSKLISSAS